MPLHATWSASLEELIPVGPIKVKNRASGSSGRTAHLLAAGITRPVALNQGFASLEIASILDHEVVVIG